MTTTDTPTTRKPKISRKWLGLLLSLVIGIASLLGYYWAKSQGWSHYDQSNSGLVSDYTNVLLIDEQSRLWVGTQFGLGVLGTDGRWTSYLEGQRVFALAAGPQGQMWVGTEEGLSVFSPDGSSKTYTTANSDLTDNTILSIAVDAHGRTWIGTVVGLNLLTPDGTWKAYTARNSALNDDSILALAAGHQDQMWIGTEHGLSVLGADGLGKTYTEASSGLAGERVSTLAIDPQGNVWAGSDLYGRGLSVLSPAGQWRVYNRANSGLGSDDVTALAFDDQGNLWIGTHSLRLLELTPDGQWKSYTRVNSGMLETAVDSLATSPTSPGVLWVGTNYQGILIYRPAESLPQGVTLGLLVLSLLGVAALVIQLVLYGGLAWEKKRRQKRIPSGEETPAQEAALETAPALPQADSRKKYVQFAGGFLGWYLVNGLIWLMLSRDGFNMEGSGLLNLCLLPLNLILPVVLSAKQRTRFIGLGILTALAVNLFVSLILGLATNAGCFIPFFIDV